VQDTKALASLDEHNIIGGLGSAVAEVLAENVCATKFKRLGIPDMFAYKLGSQAHFFEIHGLMAETVANTLVSMVPLR